MNKAKHWHCSLTCNPVGMHFCFTAGNLKSVNERFCEDLKEAVNYVAENHDKLVDFTEFYGVSINLPEELLRRNLDIFIDAMIDY